MKKIDLDLLKRRVDELHISIDEANVVDWKLIKDIICGTASILATVCKIMPDFIESESMQVKK